MIGFSRRQLLQSFYLFNLIIASVLILCRSSNGSYKHFAIKSGTSSTRRIISAAAIFPFFGGNENNNKKDEIAHPRKEQHLLEQQRRPPPRIADIPGQYQQSSSPQQRQQQQQPRRQQSFPSQNQQQQRPVPPLPPQQSQRSGSTTSRVPPPKPPKPTQHEDANEKSHDMSKDDKDMPDNGEADDEAQKNDGTSINARSKDGQRQQPPRQPLPPPPTNMWGSSSISDDPFLQQQQQPPPTFPPDYYPPPDGAWGTPPSQQYSNELEQQQQQWIQQQPSPPLFYEQQQQIGEAEGASDGASTTTVGRLMKEISDCNNREIELIQQIENLTLSLNELQNKEDLHLNQLDILTERIIDVESSAALERNKVLEYQSNCTSLQEEINKLDAELNKYIKLAKKYNHTIITKDGAIDELKGTLKVRTREAEDLAAVIETARLKEERDMEYYNEERRKRRKKKRRGVFSWVFAPFLGDNDFDLSDDDYDGQIQSGHDLAKNTLLRALQTERNNVEELEILVNTLQQNNSAISEMVASRDSLINELNDRVTVFEEDKITLKAALRQLQKEMKDEEPKKVLLKQDLQKYQKDIQRLNNDILRLKDVQKQELKALHNIIKQKDIVINETTANLTMIGTYVDKLEERIGDFTLARREIDLREQSCQVIQENSEKLEKELEDKQNIIEKQVAEEKELKLLLEELVTDRASCQERNNVLIQETNQLRTDKSILNETIATISDDIVKLELTLEEYKEQVEIMEDEMRLLQSEYNNLLLHSQEQEREIKGLRDREAEQAKHVEQPIESHEAVDDADDFADDGEEDQNPSIGYLAHHLDKEQESNDADFVAGDSVFRNDDTSPTTQTDAHYSHRSEDTNQNNEGINLGDLPVQQAEDEGIEGGDSDDTTSEGEEEELAQAFCEEKGNDGDLISREDNDEEEEDSQQKQQQQQQQPQPRYAGGVEIRYNELDQPILVPQQQVFESNDDAEDQQGENEIDLEQYVQEKREEDSAIEKSDAGNENTKVEDGTTFSPNIRKKDEGRPTVPFRQIQHQNRNIPFRKVRKAFARTTGLHGFFTKPSTPRQRRVSTPSREQLKRKGPVVSTGTDGLR